MADTVIPVHLNKGLDLVTPPLLAEQGALIDCLNYELTDIAGYRRIDGYERFDGYPDGDLQEYYQLTIVATNPANQPSIVPGVVITINSPAPRDMIVDGDPLTEDMGAVVASMGSNVYRYVPFEATLALGAGTAVNIRSLAGTTFTATVTVAPVAGRLIDTVATTYAANIRTYAATMRALVTTAPGKIAGLWRLDDHLFAAVDAKNLKFVQDDAFYTITPGMLIRFKGVVYRVLGKAPFDYGDSPIPGQVRLILVPVGTTTNTNDVYEVTSGFTTVGAAIATGSSATVDDDSDYAYVVKYNEVRTSTTRGYTTLYPIVRIAFDAGTYTSDTFPIDMPVVIKSGGTVQISGTLTHVQIDSGSFLSSNAVGHMYVALTGSALNGSRILDNYTINTALGVQIAVVNAPVIGLVSANGNGIDGPVLPGTAMLDRANTRYTAIQSNFTGSIITRAAYAANGCGRCTFNTAVAFGSVVSVEDVDLDVPKYVALHVGKLALGFAQGSVQLSVIGEPLNFSGVQGAIEIATGDPVTGLLEMPGEFLAVFGKRAIRKITGYTDADTQLGSLAAGASCYDYTAVLIGQTAVYTGVYGITSLEQSAAYGSFVGQRLSDRISVWLRPKLVTTYATIEAGGVVCAVPVRSKQQYRLFLKTGEVVILTLTEDGPRMTFANYGLAGAIMVPFAWSSDTTDDGEERIHVRWDVTGEELKTYSLDRGWGFNGAYFNHYFDTAHMFNKYGTMFMGVEKIRLFGQGYGIATLNIKSSGIEEDFDQVYHTKIQDISMPPVPATFYDRMKPVTCLIDQANWGMGIKLRVANTTAESSTSTEPSHICQVLVLHLRSEGAGDN